MRFSLLATLTAENRPTKPIQRLPEFGVGDSGQYLIELPLFIGAKRRVRGRRRLFPRGNGALVQFHPRHRPKSEVGVDSLDQHRLQMLERERERAVLDPEMEGAVAPGAARVDDLLGRREAPDVLADDGRPFRDDGRIGKPAASESSPRDFGDLRRDRRWAAAPSALVHLPVSVAVLGDGMIQRMGEQPRMKAAALRRRLLAWYDLKRRSLPWRAAPGAKPDPYRVWLSEIMLQQTTVAAVIPYFERFLRRWPRVEDLGHATQDDVLRLWQGLGYYARARNLHRCAQEIVTTCGGRFPDTEEGLRRLPGVGAYTAAAIASIAFGRKAMPVDGNVIRVIARLHAVASPLPGALPEIAALANELASERRAGDLAQALMDLGATVCAPRAPACDVCPWRNACRAWGRTPEAYPVKVRPPRPPTKRGIVFWAERADGSVLIRRRPERGLLGGMMEFPSTEWRPRRWRVEEAMPFAPVEAKWQRLPGLVRHGFTHFRLELAVLKARVNGSSAPKGTWVAIDRLADEALPTLMRKVAAQVLSRPTGRTRT